MVAKNLYQYRIFTNIGAMKFQLCNARGITSKLNWTDLFVTTLPAMAIYVTRFCMILKNMQDFAWFCKIHEKFEAFLPRIFSRNYQRLKQTLPILRYGVQKLNYQRSKLPISKVTNIEVYLYSKCSYGLDLSCSNRKRLEVSKNQKCS